MINDSKYVAFEFTKKQYEAMEVLATEGFDPAFGARPLKRIIQREIGDPAAMLLLEGKVAEGGTITVDVTDGQLTVAA